MPFFLQSVNLIVVSKTLPASQLVPLKPGAQTQCPDRSSHTPPFKQIGQSSLQSGGPDLPDGHADIKGLVYKDFQMFLIT